MSKYKKIIWGETQYSRPLYWMSLKTDTITFLRVFREIRWEQ